MKVFHTSSPQVVKECQINFGLLPIGSQLIIRTANFLQKFIASENTLCQLFAKSAATHLNSLFTQCGNNVESASRLRTEIQNQFYNSVN